jgi:16S rRNA processing protein RimM
VPIKTNIKEKDETGLPANGEPEFLSIGILRKPHGLKGEMHMEVWTDFPTRILQGKSIFLGEGKKPFVIRSFRKTSADYLIHLEGITNPEQAAILRNRIAYGVSLDSPSLPPDNYYHHEIIGLSVFSTNNELLGKISEIIQTGSNDVYVVEKTGEKKEELLLPAISSVIKKIDLKNQVMVVDPPKWA